ncbi:heme ABC transporter ATP-binding protein [Herbiconiux solani]|uniref:heme ABC transporter ATP-binding protein n=1 Tax=Herbiconiux solani TaxID=661329 RepID=UPI0009FF2345|nr:heme ABC transporter ATP-binding protein [Herbiconiux solani]
MTGARYAAGAASPGAASAETTDAASAGVASVTAPALRVRGASVEIGGASILEDVSFDAAPGEVVALIGPNGAGKSTLLAVVTGDQATTGGEVEIAGRPLGAWSLKELGRRRAVLLQQNGVFFPFSVREVVEMGRAPWQGTPRDADDDRVVDESLALTETTRFQSRPLPSLSGGERARASLARILAQETGILLLDEPTAALDLRHQEDVLRIARNRARAGDCVVVVLHDLSLAAAYADRIVLIHDGRVVADGAPDAVLTGELLSRVYDLPVEVMRHPVTGTAIILPIRQPSAARVAEPGESSKETP